MDSLTTHLDLILKVCTAAGGLYLFFRGVIEYHNSNRTKQAEFLEKLIAGFDGPPLGKAIRILDDYYFITDEEKAEVVGGEQEGKMDLKWILRDHRKSPVKSPLEIEIRDSFCALLDFFSKLNYYLHNKLISKDELEYFRYYINRAKQNEAVQNYITSYYHNDDFKLLFRAVDKLSEQSES